MLYYQSVDGTRIGSQMPFNFVLIENLNENSSAEEFTACNYHPINYNIPKGQLANWVIGNHDRPRVGSRYGSARIDAFATTGNNFTVNCSHIIWVKKLECSTIVTA